MFGRVGEVVGSGSLVECSTSDGGVNGSSLIVGIVLVWFGSIRPSQKLLLCRDGQKKRSEKML